jgi:cytochrome c551/c552
MSLPILILFNISALSDTAISGYVYSIAGIVILIFFVAAHFVYGYCRTSQTSAITVAFALFLCATVLLVISDNIAIGTVTRSQATIQALIHEKSVTELKFKLGIITVSFTGEDIYNSRCSACHLFDQKKVGPPYIETIPKYQGRKSELVAFILNPIKKNSAYSPMPNPGLMPAEADSIASYILKKLDQMESNSIK